MECKINAVIHSEDHEIPYIKEERYSEDETTELQTSHVQLNEKQFVKCVQISDVDTKIGILQETWDLNVPSNDIKCNPKQRSLSLDTGSIKGDDEMDLKAEPFNQTESQKHHLQQSYTYLFEYNESSDENTKVGIKQEAWNQNGVLSDIKCDPEQSSICLGTDTIKGGDEIDIKEEHWWCEETSTDLLNEEEGSGSKKNETTEDVPMPETLRPYTGAVISTKATQLQENKYTNSMFAKTNTTTPKHVAKYRYKACGKRFKKKQNLVHTECKSKNIDKKCTGLGFPKDHLIHNNTREYVCDTCGKTFLQVSYFKAHLLLHDHKRQYKCQICEKSFKQSAHLKAHQWIHDDIRNYKCQICGKRFRYSSHLKTHQSVHEDIRKYKCQVCEKSYKQSAHLKAHQLIHNDKWQYKCHICEKRFKQLRGLKIHLVVHDDKRKYKCQICEKSFKQSGNLRTHLSVHDDKRQFKCQICEKSFKLLSVLKTHLLIHDDKRKFKCKICAKSFKQPGHLKSHLLVHDDKRQYKCQICGKSFKKLCDLKTHLFLHDNKRQFQCEICPKSFNLLSYLKRHHLVHDKRQCKC